MYCQQPRNELGRPPLSETPEETSQLSGVAVSVADSEPEDPIKLGPNF